MASEVEGKFRKSIRKDDRESASRRRGLYPGSGAANSCAEHCSLDLAPYMFGGILNKNSLWGIMEGTEEWMESVEAETANVDKHSQVF